MTHLFSCHASLLLMNPTLQQDAKENEILEINTIKMQVLLKYMGF